MIRSVPEHYERNPWKLPDEVPLKSDAHRTKALSQLAELAN
jgi:hypothetical protein